MRLHRFFVEEVLKDSKKVVIKEKNLVHQWRDVLRLKPGNEVILLDNTGFEYFSVIVDIQRDAVWFEIRDVQKNMNISHTHLHLFPSLIKKERFEWILEKGTEVGVSEFTPIISDRSQNKDLNIKRGKKIIKEAAEQSGKGLLPTINDPKEVEDVVSQSNLDFFVLDPDGQSFEPGDIRSDKVANLGILTGPEGGWSEDEKNLFRDKNIPMYSLGNQILRAETAAMAVSSLILLGRA